MDAFARHHTMEPTAKADAPSHMAFYPLGYTYTVVYKGDGTALLRIRINGSSINRARANDPDPGPYEASNDHYRSSSPTASYDSLLPMLHTSAKSSNKLISTTSTSYTLTKSTISHGFRLVWTPTSTSSTTACHRIRQRLITCFFEATCGVTLMLVASLMSCDLSTYTRAWLHFITNEWCLLCHASHSATLYRYAVPHSRRLCCRV